MTAPGMLSRLLAALTIAAAALWLALNRERLDPSALEAAISALGWWAPFAHVALFAIGTVLFVPGTLFGLAGGALFGPVWGTLLNLAGATLGATAAFLAARYLAPDWVRAKAGGKLERLVSGVEAEGWRFVALARLVPLVPFNILNYALGLTRIPLIAYVAASFICMVPGTLAYTWLGHAGRGAAAGNTAAVRYGLLALALLAAIALLPRLIRRWQGEQKLRWVEVAELAHRVASKHPIAIIDVRAPNDFTGPLGHIGGAHNLPLAEVQRRLPELAELKNEPVVLVCRTHKMSASAADLLDAAGFTNVGVLRGGMVQWNVEGHPVDGHAGEEEAR
jgi:uncharacterized membrane protein YdjX (TVP38/TMEM64 family)/rhodanese-related sulfurtransferase